MVNVKNMNLPGMILAELWIIKQRFDNVAET